MVARMMFPRMPCLSWILLSGTVSGTWKTWKCRQPGCQLWPAILTRYQYWEFVWGIRPWGFIWAPRLHRSSRPMHGKVSWVKQTSRQAFLKGVPDQFQVTPYHSLELKGLPPELEVVFWKRNRGEIMAMCHQNLPVIGLTIPSWSPSHLMREKITRQLGRPVCTEKNHKNTGRIRNISWSRRKNCFLFPKYRVDFYLLNKGRRKGVFILRIPF